MARPKKDKEYHLTSVFENYIPEVCAFEIKNTESSGRTFGYYIQYLGKNTASKKDEAAIIYSQKVFNNMDEAILSGLDVLELLGYEADEDKEMKFQVEEIDQKTMKYVNKIYSYDGDTFKEIFE